MRVVGIHAREHAIVDDAEQFAVRLALLQLEAWILGDLVDAPADGGPGDERQRFVQAKRDVRRVSAHERAVEEDMRHRVFVALHALRSFDGGRHRSACSRADPDGTDSRMQGSASRRSYCAGRSTLNPIASR